MGSGQVVIGKSLGLDQILGTKRHQRDFSVTYPSDIMICDLQARKHGLRSYHDTSSIWVEISTAQNQLPRLDI